jgi:hypothetical protein
MLVGGLVLAGGGSVIAASGGSSSTSSAAATQYCPDGSPKPASGDCGKVGGGGTAGGGGEKPGKKHKHKKPKFRVHRHPRTGCIARTFAARVSVSNKPSGRKTFVYRDGRMVLSTSRRSFKVHFDVSGMSRGSHTVRLRVRGADGKWVTRRISFRRC